MIAPNNVDLSALVRRFGSPIYVYDLAEIRASRAELAAALPRGAPLLYSLKANPHPVLVRELADAGCGAEVSSAAELRTAVAAGIDAAIDIVYTGPAKSSAEIREAIALGARLFSTDSANQFEAVARVAAQERVEVRALVRINPERGTARAGLHMTGVPSQFGVDADVVERDSAQFASRAACELVGLHFYLGSNSPTSEALAAEFSSSLATSARLVEVLGIEPRLLDLGGGFARSYARRTAEAPLHGLRESLDAAAARTFPTTSGGGPQLAFESGRFLTATCGTLVATVVDVKRSKGKQFAILDSGIHHLGGLPALGRIPKGTIAVESADGDSNGPTDVVGPLCTPLDWWQRNAPDRYEIGQLVSVPNVGAYGLTASLVGFLSRPAPVEVVVDDGRVVHASRVEIVRRDTSF